MPAADRPDGPRDVAAGFSFEDHPPVLFHAVVPAAGMGDRFGGAKQFAPVAGRPLLAWSIDRLLAAGATSVVVVLPAADVATAPQRLTSDARVTYAAGGATRQASVAAGLAASPAGAGDMVAVHDGARAAVDPLDVRAVVAAAKDGGGAVLGRPLVDTIKQVAGDRIVRTVERELLRRAETPQVFRRELLEQALAAADADGFVGTDEASLIERLGGVVVRLVMARRPNPKVTWLHDLESVARLLGDRTGVATAPAPEGR